MPKFEISFSVDTAIYVQVEADNLHAALQKAYDEGVGGLCHQCTGNSWAGDTWSRDEGDEWTPLSAYSNNELIHDFEKDGPIT